MKLFKSVVLSAWLLGSTSLCSNAYAVCSSCGDSSTPASSTVREGIFSGTRPRVTRSEVFLSGTNNQTNEPRNSAAGPIFGTNDCTTSNRPIFGDNNCVRRKCGGAMFGPQTCKKIELPCENCKTEQNVETAPREAFIQNYKTIPADNIYEKTHKCSDLAPLQLEWVDFRLRDGHSDSFSRTLGKYRFRLFGCRRFDKKAMLNEGRIIQKNMRFIEIFEDIVNDCYNIVKVPNELCLREQNYRAPEYILTAEITDYFMNICDGYNWDAAQKEDKRTGSAEMTVTWRLLDLAKTKVLWKGETTGYSELPEGIYNGEIALIEDAFADAVSNLKGMPEFENQLAIRVDKETIKEQKNILLAMEQAADPVKCKVPAKKAETCPIAPENLNTPQITDNNQTMQQCQMPAEIIEYVPQQTVMDNTDIIPLELGTSLLQEPYAENNGNICYGYNNDQQIYDLDASTINNTGDSTDSGYILSSNSNCNQPALISYLEPDENICENPLFNEPGQECDPSLMSFIHADQECQREALEKLLEPQGPQVCLFKGDDVSSSGGISIDTGYYIPEVETVSSDNKITQSPEWKAYEEPTIMRQPDIVENIDIAETANIVEAGTNIAETVTIKEENGGYTVADDFCIENVAPHPDMRPENLYKVRASMMSVENSQGQKTAGLLIANDLILTSANLINNDKDIYNIETINGVKAKAKVIRINVKKNTALLQTTDKMYFRPLSLNMELPPVGRGGYMSLGLLNNAEGENYLDDKGKIKGYRFSDEMGTEIITDTFVQTVSSGGALIDENGVVNGLASRSNKFDDSGDLFTPIQDAINSVGLKVCGQAEPFVQAPTAVLKPISTAIDSYSGSKEPTILAKDKRK